MCRIEGRGGNMRRFLLFSICLLIVFSLVSCATVFSGSTSDVSILSDPAGASVSVDGVEVAYTPITLPLSKKSSHTIAVSADGYKSEYFIISSSAGAGWIVLDVLAGGVPLIVDAVTGNWNKLSPDTVAVTLRKAE